MAKRILQRKQSDRVSADVVSLETDELASVDLAFDNFEPKATTSKSPTGQPRTHDSESAIWKEKDYSIDSNSIASSNNIIDSKDNKSVSSDEEPAVEVFQHNQLGGIDEIAIDSDSELNTQVLVLENSRINKAKKRAKDKRIRAPKKRIKLKTKQSPGVKRRGIERSDSTKRLIRGSTASSTGDSGTTSTNSSKSDGAVNVKSDSISKRSSNHSAYRLSTGSKETDRRSYNSKTSDKHAKESRRKASVDSRRNNGTYESNPGANNEQFIKPAGPGSLLWQQAPRELRENNNTSFDDTHKFRTFTGASFQDHIRVFKPPKVKAPQPNSGGNTTKQGIVQLARPQSFTQIAAEIPPEKPSKYDLTVGTVFIADKPHKLPITNTMASAHMTVHKRSVKQAHSMTSLHSLYAENGAISRYTVRGLSALPQELKVVAVPPELQRSTLRKARTAIEMAISNFHIVFDSNTPHYQPGMPVTGKVVMDVWSTVDIRYVEFVLQGKATIRLFGSDGKFLEKPHTEVYLQKRIILLSPADGEDVMVLTPGKYVSEFAYKLPDNLPATVEQTDVSDHCVFSVTYSARANVCDFLHARHVPHSDRYAQVVKTCRREFTVLPQYDYRCLPGAMDPITHAEQFNLLCSPINKGHTSVLVKLDHQLFALGDVMNLSLEVCTANTNRIKNITANMVQTVIFQPPVSRKFKRTVIKAIDIQRNKHNQNAKKNKATTTGEGKNVYRCSFGIPIPNTLIPSLLLHARIIQVSYSMDIKVSFKHFGGALHMRIPVVLTSAMEPEGVSITPHVPVFNKPVMQFPYFSRGPLRDSMKSLASTGSAGSRESTKMNGTTPPAMLKQKHERVRTNYVHCFSF